MVLRAPVRFLEGPVTTELVDLRGCAQPDPVAIVPVCHSRSPPGDPCGHSRG